MLVSSLSRLLTHDFVREVLDDPTLPVPHTHATPRASTALSALTRTCFPARPPPVPDTPTPTPSARTGTRPGFRG